VEGGGGNMYSYELTERGKIIIAIIIVILVFVLPSVILAINAWSNTAPPIEEPPRSEAPGTNDTPAISNGPLPDGSGFDPNEPPEDNGDEQDSTEPPEEPVDPPSEEPVEPEEEQEEVPEFGFVDLNQARGIMKFTFSPDHQVALDEDTISALADFVTSPRNTARAYISIETPTLSNEDSAIFKTALTDALTQHGVRANQLVFNANSSSAYERAFDVILSFQQPTSGK